jgi:hypothetical protein
VVRVNRDAIITAALVAASLDHREMGGGIA